MRTPLKAFLSLCLIISLSVPVSLALAQDGNAPGDAVKSLAAGKDFYKAGEFNDALGAFMKARELLPDDPDILFYLGMTYMKLTETERAAEFFQMALDKKPDYTDAEFQLGSAQVIMKEYAEALPHLEAVHDRMPDKLNLGYMLGLAYYNTGQYDKALAAFEGGKATDKNIVSLNLYYTGLTKVRLGMVDEAGSAYKELINIDPTSPLAPSSERLMDVLAAAAQAKKRYHLQVSAKLQYDTNAILAPTEDIFNLRERDRNTVVEFIYLRGSYSLVKKKDDDLSVSYSLIQTFNNSVPDIDFQDHIFSISGLHKGMISQKPFYLRTTYSYDHALLDSKSYLNRHIFRPSLTIIESPKHLTLLQYSLQGKNFVSTPDMHQEDRDSLNHEVGLVHYMRYAGDKHYVYGGYFHDTENASGSDWDYEGDKLMLGAQYMFPRKYRLNLDYSYKSSRFDNENVVFGEKRVDGSRIVSATLTKEVMKDLFVSLEFLYNHNDSTVTLYDFEKEVYSIGAVWRF